MSPRTLNVQTPDGERLLTLPVRLGGAEPDVALPEPPPTGLSIAFSGSQWMLRVADQTVLVNGRPQEADCPLLSGDVIEAGGAQLALRLDAGQPRLSVYPLRGNDTIAPLSTVQIPGEEVAAGTREIRVADAGVSGDAPGAGGSGDAVPRGRRRGIAAGVLVLAALFGAALWWIVPVGLLVTPEVARVQVPDSLHWRVGHRLFVPAGVRTLEISSPGYRSERVTLEVNRALAAAPPRRIELALLPGILNLDTQGIAAEVIIDGDAAGTAPGAVHVLAGRRSVLVRAPRYIDFLADIDVEGAGVEQALVARLEPAWGWLEIDTRPSAHVFVDGRDLGQTPQRLELDSGLRMLDVRAPGRRSWRSQVAIVAGQTLQLGVIDLATPPPAVIAQASSPAPAEEVARTATASTAPPAARVQSALPGTLILVPAGSFMQGSDRREQGRRSNETLRSTTLSQPFYLAEREVTNAQFRAFRAAHASGIAADRTLDLDGFAVSSVSWDDAVAFCNWLSQREGLPLAYERRDGRWQLVEPFNPGYRLPTEAEWEYAARYVDGQRWRRFAWGDGLPPPAGAENLAGDEVNAGKPASLRATLTLPGQRDEHAVVAPVGTYGRSALGFADLGGNVSEWMHDTYASLLSTAQVTDPRGENVAGPHVIRGANWRTASVQELRLAWRDASSGPQQILGFRVARSVEVAR